VGRERKTESHLAAAADAPADAAVVLLAVVVARRLHRVGKRAEQQRWGRAARRQWRRVRACARPPIGRRSLARNTTSTAAGDRKAVHTSPAPPTPEIALLFSRAPAWGVGITAVRGVGNGKGRGEVDVVVVVGEEAEAEAEGGAEAVDDEHLFHHYIAHLLLTSELGRYHRGSPGGVIKF
jgi:hypothetical protein